MSLPKLNAEQALLWHSPEVAKTWCEGSVVLVLRPDRTQTHSGFIETCQWFRPDLIDGHYVRQGRTLFFKLADPDNK